MMLTARAGLHWLFLSIFFLIVNPGITKAPAWNNSEDILFIPQSGTPTGIPNFLTPESACNWFGIGGQLFDLTGNPMPGLVIKLEGELDGESILLYTVSGGEQKLGPAGFALKIAEEPVTSVNTITIQVLDISGDILTPRIRIRTYDDCQRNLILVNIQESLLQNPTYFPLIGR